MWNRDVEWTLYLLEHINFQLAHKRPTVKSDFTSQNERWLEEYKEPAGPASVLSTSGNSYMSWVSFIPEITMPLLPQCKIGDQRTSSRHPVVHSWQGIHIPHIFVYLLPMEDITSTFTCAFSFTWLQIHMLTQFFYDTYTYSSIHAFVYNVDAL